MAIDQLLNVFIPQGLLNNQIYYEAVRVGTFILQALLYSILILGPYLYWLFYVKVYDYKAIIFSRTQGYPIRFTKGRIKTDKSGNRYFTLIGKFPMLWKSKVRLNPINLELIKHTIKGAKVVFLEQIADAELVPMKVEISSNPGTKLIPIEEDLKLMFILNQKAINAQYGENSWWKQNQIMILSLGALVIFGFVMWMVLSKTEVLIRLADAGQQRAYDILERLGKAGIQEVS